MFVDELTIEARAGNGGNGVVRWRREKYRPNGGPSGGNGGKGGDVYMLAVRDLSLLSKYTGEKLFSAEDGSHGSDRSKHGNAGEDMIIKVPVGSKVTDTVSGRVFEFSVEGEKQKILHGGPGGLGNEYFKSSTNQSPEESTPGKQGEASNFLIELSLVVDIGFIGYPNAGKSTLLNTLTNATARIGAYPFTTVEPHLGDLHGFILADIPGLIEGASGGKGLGHKFLRHIQKTKMLLHCISFENEDLTEAYQTIRNELKAFDATLLDKPEWVLLTKSDLVGEVVLKDAIKLFEERGVVIHAVSAQEGTGVKTLREALLKDLRLQESAA